MQLFTVYIPAHEMNEKNLKFAFSQALLLRRKRESMFSQMEDALIMGEMELEQALVSTGVETIQSKTHSYFETLNKLFSSWRQD